MEPPELASKIANGWKYWGETEISAALDYRAGQIKDLSLAVMQRAADLSPSDNGQIVRQRAFYFVSILLRAAVGDPLVIPWEIRFAEYCRRLQEGNPNCYMGDLEETRTKLVELEGRLADLAEGPRAAAEKSLANVEKYEQGGHPLDRDARLLLAWERAYWLTLDGNYVEATRMLHGHAAACAGTGDNLGAALFAMQAAQNGIRALKKGKPFNRTPLSLLGSYEGALTTLEEHRGDPAAQQWLRRGGNVEAHAGQLVELDSGLADRVDILIANLILAREGKYSTPDIAGID